MDTYKDGVDSKHMQDDRRSRMVKIGRRMVVELLKGWLPSAVALESCCMCGVVLNDGRRRSV